MVNKLVSAFITKSRVATVSAVLALAFTATGAISLLQPANATPEVAAASCDAVNIIHCGLSGSATSSYIKSFKHYYTAGSDGRYHDLKAVYHWAGASNSDVSGMNTANTKVGTMYRNGDVKVGGKVVARNSWFAARFGAGRSGFVHVTGNVWARKTTTSLANNSYRVIVHFNQNGVADFAIAVSCGNAIKFTPVIPPSPPKPSLSCERLTFSVINRYQRSYEFKARANVKNTKITSYVFKFGDGTSMTVRTSNLTVTARHQYAKAGKTFTARVIVNGKDVQNASGPHCVVKITTPKPPTTPALVCESLTFSAVAGQANTYQFTATASASHTTITDYVFAFDDSNVQPVKTANGTATTTHSFADNTEHTATVAVNSTKIKNATSAKCKVTIPSQTQPTPEHLPTTGAGNVIGFFGATSLAGGLIHRFILRRKVA